MITPGVAETPAIVRIANPGLPLDRHVFQPVCGLRLLAVGLFVLNLNVALPVTARTPQVVRVVDYATPTLFALQERHEIELVGRRPRLTDETPTALESKDK